MTYPCFAQPHDPEDAKTYAFRFGLNDGDSITTATIVIVEPDGHTPILGSDLIVNSVQPGTVDAYGAVFFRPQGGTDKSIYLLRCDATTQMGDVYFDTLGLRVEY